jgi:hypothetical protein
MVISNEAITILIFIYILIVNVHFNRVKRRPYSLDIASSLTPQSNKGRQLLLSMSSDIGEDENRLDRPNGPGTCGALFY